MTTIASKAILGFLLAWVAGAAPQARTQAQEGNVTTRNFGTMKDGRAVTMYTLKNTNGMTVSVITYGARMVGIDVPDKSGAFGDVLLGYGDLSGYLADTFYLGPIVGRYANRIALGKFTLNGHAYQVTVNDGRNSLHGGATGFHTVVWDAHVNAGSKDASVTMEHRSPAGEDGFPGNVSVSVTYTLDNRNELRIDYRGTTDQPTIMNLTSHGYFNLTGNPANAILGHELMIAADSITAIDSTLIPTGEMMAVQGTPFDFRTPVAVGARINEANQELKYGRGYDHNWVLERYDGSVRLVASVYEPKSGRFMEVLTDQPGIQFYSGNFLDGSAKGKSGIPYAYRTGLCLETQHYPDSPNEPGFPPVTLLPGQVYKQTTMYRFSTK